jgi:hypothetical protein
LALIYGGDHLFEQAAFGNMADEFLPRVIALDFYSALKGALLDAAANNICPSPH